MFDGLNDIPWADLRHAYGSADEVPMWLRQLTTTDERKRQSAMHHLTGSICHQGWICPATAYAVPYLIELLREPSIQGKQGILDLLRAIAAADPLDDATWRHNPDVPSWEVPERMPFKDAHAAVAEGIPVYVALLADEDPKVRMQAAATLCSFAERRQQHRQVLLEAFGRETDQGVRANLILALGRLTESKAEHWAYFQELIEKHENDLSRYAAAQALARLAKEQTPEYVIQLLAAIMFDPPTELAAYKDLPLRSGTIWSAAIWTLYEVGPERLRFLVAPLSEQIAKSDERDQIDSSIRVNFLLYILFGGTPDDYQQSRPASELSEQQRAGLALCVSRETIWHDGGFTDELKRRGLPSK